ncbi:hypothetical protein Z043_115209 [Scleropages formosus]|uniref:Cilia- and flagella-associated protein 161 n=2 Tax=Scleropages formosus TaxID=113540 RepID=A0A0P7WX71_SCLFO|nr:cilia- and flagella-associated protein 161 [Scleropages formosus]KPP66299.1 hypothetical protein Z043_115209 [Scleropages formosus]
MVKRKQNKSCQWRRAARHETSSDPGAMAHVRTYSPAVRVGNWCEDVFMEEEMLKDFLDKRNRGELTMQKTDFVKENVLRKVDLSVTTDGWLRFGDVVMLVNPGTDRGDWQSTRDPVAVCMSVDPGTVQSRLSVQAPCPLTGTQDLEPCVRTAFVVTSVDGTPVGEPLRYSQSFALRTTQGFGGQLYLVSDHRTFLRCANRSRLQQVSLTDEESFLTWWQVVYLDPQERLENERLPVPANTKVLVVHCKTNQCLAVLGNHSMWTIYGKEYEVTAHTFLDSHKAEREMNHWIFVTDVRGTEGQGITDKLEPTSNLVPNETSEYDAHKGTDDHGEEEKQN